jgi:Receptor L domain
MKKLIFLLTISIFGAISCTKKEDGLRQLDEYQTLYKGNVFITGNTDMSVFKNITTIDGSLTLSDGNGHPSVGNTTPVTDISALKNLKTITGNFTLSNINQLKSLEALSNLETINGDVVIASSSLTSFSGLQKLTRLKSMVISSAGPELSLKGFGKDIGITQLTINHNFNLKKLTDLESLGVVTFFSLQGNANLTSVGDMVNTTIGNQFIISGSPLLTSLGKINVSSAAAVHITDTDLDNLSCLSNITKLQQLIIGNNKNLRTLNLEKFTNITNFTLHNTNYIKSLSGLENCKIISASISNNFGLEHVDALKNMNGGNYVYISNNPNLKSIEGLSNLGETNMGFGFVSITGNINLSNLCPIAKVVRQIMKARETNAHIQVPDISNNAVRMTVEEMMKNCL